MRWYLCYDLTEVMPMRLFFNAIMVLLLCGCQPGADSVTRDVAEFPDVHEDVAGVDEDILDLADQGGDWADLCSGCDLMEVDVTTTCVLDVDCDDGNPCTDDFCDEGLGCRHVLQPDGEPCDTGDACALHGECQAGLCDPQTLVDCDDDNPCTVEECDAVLGCVQETLDGVACLDDDPCTVGELCESGVCVGVTLKSCDDENPCTGDFCVPGVGCQHSIVEGSCGVDDPCVSNGTCQLGVCIGEFLDCADGNPCTQDVCKAGVGCVHEILAGSSCNDGFVCTQDDRCDFEGHCAGQDADCNDLNSCTVDQCAEESGGCFYTALPGEPCDDGDSCTVNDQCDSLFCRGSAMKCDDGDEGTVDSCVAGECVYESI